MKKTWIKVKRGILEPKHIAKLGQAWYLYLYILDNADWDSGTIPEWKDKYAADELGKPLGMIREHRKLLVTGEYITCKQKQRCQIITIRNWTNPRRYDGIVQNEDGLSKEKHEPKKSESKSQGSPQGSGQGSGQGVGEQADNSLPSYNHIPHITEPHIKKKLIKLTAAEKKIIIQSDFNPYFVIWERETSLPIKQKKGDTTIQDTADLFASFIEADVTPSMFCEAIRGQMADARYKTTTPQSVRTWAMNSAKKKGGTFWEKWSKRRDGAAYRKSWQSWLSE